jgi:hypothetical protein
MFILTERPAATHIELSGLTADEPFNGIRVRGLGLDRQNRDEPRHLLYHLEQLLQAVGR